MTYNDIYWMRPINDTDPEEVDELVESIKKSGWVGCPILVCNDQLLTGSHRITALKRIADEDWDFDMEALGDIAEDVTDIVEEHMEAFEGENGYRPDIDYAAIGWMLEGSWVEKYKNEIVEW